MKKIEILTGVKQRLLDQGYSGLYYPGECGCGIGDLAPCGECRQGDGEGEYINGCEPGHKHFDMRPGHVEYGDYIVTDSKEAPDEDDFDGCYN